MMYLLYCACESICSLLEERDCCGVLLLGVFGGFFFVLFPQDIMYYLVKNKTNCGALSNSYTATLPGDGSPGWVARNLCATEC